MSLPLSPARRLPRASSRWLPVAVSVLGVGFIAWRFTGQWPELSRGVHDLRLSWLSLAWLVYTVTFSVLAARLKLILGAYGFRHSLNRYVALTLIGAFFSGILPASVGGDVVKAAYAAERGERLPEAILGVLADRGMGLVGVIVLAELGLWLHRDASIGAERLPEVGSLLLLGLAIGIAVSGLGSCRGWIDRQLDDSGGSLARFVKRVGRATVRLSRHPRLLVGAFLLTLVAQGLGALTLWGEARAFGMNVSLPILLLAVPVIALATIVPSVNGIGVREAALVIALRGLLSEPQALLLALTFDALTVSASLIGAGVFLLRRRLGIQMAPGAGEGVKDQEPEMTASAGAVISGS